VLAIAVDAVRGDDREGNPPSAVAVPRAGAVAALTSLGTRGTLVYTDRDCRFHAVRLPSLAETRAPPDESGDCSFELSPDGMRVAPAGAAWNASEEYAICNRAYVELRTSTVDLPRRIFSGCAPAWRPGTPPTLTLVDDGQVVAVGASCGLRVPCGTVVIDRDAIQAAARQHPNVPDAPAGIEAVEVGDVAWLARDLAVLLLRVRIPRLGTQDLVAVFENGRVRGSYYFLDDDRDRLEVSRGSRYIAAGTAFAVRADGPRLAIPDAFGEVRALAWSPDERWLAIAARDVVALVRVGASATPRVVALPIDAADVAWAPE
jgi:hypothetical protein